MFTRDPLKEENAIQLFEKYRGRKPNTQEEWNQIFKASYSQEELPDDMKTSPSQGLGIQGIRQSGARAFADTAQQRAVDYTSHGPTGINTLQMALKKKVGVGTPEGQDIGPSDIYKQAGLTGYGSLASSLNARANEIDAGYKKYTNWIDSAISGWGAEQTKLQNNAKLALENYKIEMDEYTRLSDRMNEVQDNITKNEQALELYKQKDAIDRETFLFEQANEASTAKTMPFNADTIAAGIAGMPESYAFDILHNESPALEYVNAYVDNMSQEELDEAMKLGGLGLEKEFDKIEKDWGDKRQGIIKAYEKEPTQKDKETKVIVDLKEDIKLNFSWEETVNAYPELELKDIFEAFVALGRKEDIPVGISDYVKYDI